MASGLLLLLTGPADPGPFEFLHNATFVLWLPIVALHVLAYIRRVPTLIATEWNRRGPLARSVDITVGSLLIGLIAGVAALPSSTPWTAPGAFSQGLGGPVIAASGLTMVVLGARAMLAQVARRR